ncbi:hypothetical protein BS50DRAFT_594398 [Corynespora cassiicola Philippines]|uniref:Uncharacterized protein n=1 Tax=Corynespora cassiicola Philippines TaxID=1448308 RepID=A0A2T2N407_CORCC|nr:hypothetical protein BS50DRAFT_594398 [Corynespora cassiicola Philippines]
MSASCACTSLVDPCQGVNRRQQNYDQEAEETSEIKTNIQNTIPEGEGGDNSSSNDLVVSDISIEPFDVVSRHPQYPMVLSRHEYEAQSVTQGSHATEAACMSLTTRLVTTLPCELRDMIYPLVFGAHENRLLGYHRQHRIDPMCTFRKETSTRIYYPTTRKRQCWRACPQCHAPAHRAYTSMPLHFLGPDFAHGQTNPYQIDALRFPGPWRWPMERSCPLQWMLPGFEIPIERYIRLVELELETDQIVEEWQEQRGIRDLSIELRSRDEFVEWFGGMLRGTLLRREET